MKTTRLDLAPGVDVRLARIDEVDEAAYPALFARMSPERQARCRRYRREHDRRRCILADALARQVLAEGSGVAPEAIAILPGPGGKPRAPETGLDFSLSHSGDLVLCAAAAFPIGADLQRRRPVSEVTMRRLARAGYPGHSEAEFFRWWVRQEAAGKLTGRGLSLSPLPGELVFLDGTLTQGDGRYDYSICTKRAFLI